MNGWIAQEIKLSGANQAVAASQTKQVVSEDTRFTFGGATKQLRVDVTAASVTAGAGITFALQHTSDGSTWSDVGAPKTTSITGNGEFSLLWNGDVAADAAYMPFKTRFRVVCTTGAGSAVTFTSIRALMEV